VSAAAVLEKTKPDLKRLLDGERVVNFFTCSFANTVESYFGRGGCGSHI
jgi:hypothetical protein